MNGITKRYAVLVCAFLSIASMGVTYTQTMYHQGGNGCPSSLEDDSFCEAPLFGHLAVNSGSSNGLWLAGGTFFSLAALLCIGEYLAGRYSQEDNEGYIFCASSTYYYCDECGLYSFSTSSSRWARRYVYGSIYGGNLCNHCMRRVSQRVWRASAKPKRRHNDVRVDIRWKR